MEAVKRTEKAQSRAEYSVRRSKPSDIPLLEPVERSAGEVFRTVNLGFLLDGPTVDPALLSSLADLDHLWVAVNKKDNPIGFLGGADLDGYFHIIEISVSEDSQRKGVGKALMARMVEDVQQEGYKAITLTTYRDLAWNGPWYTKMGFSEVSPLEMGRKYEEIIEEEREHGHDVTRRCVMRRIL